MMLPEVLPGDVALVRRRRDALRAKADQAVARFQALSDSVGKAKARVDANGAVQAVLTEMQQLGHARSVGVYERLLTALLTDVFPDERKVHLDLYTDRGLPALDLFVSKQANLLEDTETGTGGGVTNGLSTGLRFIALIRSGRRPFIVLDEPDCWMEEHRVPAFMELIQQTATQLGIQVLLISHHPDELLSAIPYRLKLGRGPKGLEIHWTPSSDIPVWEPDQPGLRGVTFEHCYGHTHTYLPLAPGVTLLRGSNDEGKSTLIATLNMILEGKTKDAMIQHNQSVARVTMDFGPDKVVHFERRRTGSPKVRYELRDPALGPKADPLRSSTDGRNRPDWLLEVTGIGAVDDLNIQLTDQKSPVFLLNQTNTQRAKALAVGRGNEAAFIRQLMALDKEEVQEARTHIRQGEKELEHLHRQILALQPLMEPDTLVALEEMAHAWQARRHQQADQRRLVERWRRLRHVRQVLRPIQSLPPLRAPAVSPSGTWRWLWRQWHGTRRLVGPARALAARVIPVAPSVPQGGRWRQLQHQWQRAQAQRQRLQAVPASSPRAPTLTPSTLRPLWERWRRLQAQRRVMQAVPTQGVGIPTLGTQGPWRPLLRQWQGMQDRVTQARADVAQAEGAIQAIETEQAQLRTVMQCTDATCPVCQRPWD